MGFDVKKKQLRDADPNETKRNATVSSYFLNAPEYSH